MFFFSSASSACQSDGFLIVLKGSWEHRLSLSLYSSSKTLGKLKGECQRHLKLFVSLLCFSTHAFLNASLQSGSLFIAFSVFQGWGGAGGTEGRERSYWLKHEDIHLDKWFIAPKTATRECHTEKVVLMWLLPIMLLHKSRTWLFKRFPTCWRISPDERI